VVPDGLRRPGQLARGQPRQHLALLPRGQGGRALAGRRLGRRRRPVRGPAGVGHQQPGPVLHRRGQAHVHAPAAAAAGGAGGGRRGAVAPRRARRPPAGGGAGRRPEPRPRGRGPHDRAGVLLPAALGVDPARRRVRRGRLGRVDPGGAALAGARRPPADDSRGRRPGRAGGGERRHRGDPRGPPPRPTATWWPRSSRRCSTTSPAGTGPW
jgi:hypothetical protein